ncbi:MAG: shikimate dehydrogenase family protein, partial [Bacteroidia bacterium]
MKRFGLIGFPLTHSFSQAYFTEKFQHLGLVDLVYANFPLTSIEEFPTILEQHSDLAGLNVTIPYKQSIIPYLDELDALAEAVGAVNTIKISERNGKRFLKGFNTDVYGFRQSIKPFLTSAHERALIFGTGGAAAAIRYALTDLGIDCLTISRKPAGEKSFPYEAVNDYMLQACKLLVNCTPVGMHPDTNAFPPIPYAHL